MYAPYHHPGRDGAKANQAVDMLFNGEGEAFNVCTFERQVPPNMDLTSTSGWRLPSQHFAPRMG